MPDMIVEKSILLMFYPLVGTVSGEREHSQ